MLSLLPTEAASSNTHHHHLHHTQSSLEIREDDYSIHSDYDPLSTGRESFVNNINNIEEEIGESLDTISSNSGSEELFFGMEPTSTQNNQHHHDPSSHGSFPADVEEEIEVLPGEEDDDDSDKDLNSSEERGRRSNMRIKTHDMNYSVDDYFKSLNGKLPSPTSLPNLNDTIEESLASDDSNENTPKKATSSIIYKKRFPVPISEPVFSPRKDRLLKHCSTFYFHPETAQCSHDSQLVSPKEYSSFLSRHSDFNSSPSSYNINSPQQQQSAALITHSSVYTTWSDGSNSIGSFKTNSATTAMNNTTVKDSTIEPSEENPNRTISHLPSVSLSNVKNLTERQKNLLYSIKVAKVVKESNHHSTTNNNCNKDLNHQHHHSQQSTVNSNSEKSPVTVSKKLGLSEFTVANNNNSNNKNPSSNYRIKEEILAQLSSPLKRKLKKEDIFDSTVQPLTSFRSDEGREVSAVEEWIAFQKQRITEDDNIEDTTGEGIFEFTQVKDSSLRTSTIIGEDEQENNNMTSNSLSPPFHLIKRSSNKTMQLISSDIPIVHNASSTALFANIPPILKPLQLSQASSAQLEKKQHQVVRNSIQQFRSNKHALHTVPKPTVSKSQIVPPSAKTSARPMVAQPSPNLVIPNQHVEDVKPVRRKNVPVINVPQIKITEKMQTYASLHQLKSPSNHKQQDYELAADSVFVVVSGDVLNEIREKNEKVERKRPYEIIYFDKSLSRVKQVVPCGSFTIFVAEGKETERVFVIYKENPLLHPTKKVENVYNKYFTFCNSNFHPQLREVDYKTLIRTEFEKNNVNLDPYVLQDPKSLELTEVYGTQDAFMLKMRNNFCIFIHFAETAEKVKISFFEEYAGGTIDWIETNPCSNTLLLYGHARGRTNYLLDIMVLDPEPRRRKLQLPPEISQNNIRIIRVGLHRIIIVTNDNQLYIHRSEKKGSETSENFELFDKVWEAPIRQVRCGGYHNVVLLQNGNIYAWGFNNHYQCGIYENVKNKIPMVPITLLNQPKTMDGEITDIQASYLTTSVITTNGVWTIGDMTAKLNTYVKSTDGLKYSIIPFAKFNFLLNAMWSSGDHLVLFNHSENHEGIQGYFSKNLSKMLHIESSQDEKSKRQ
ncbi:predicted protein [Naegleria gruberi]|uniref:Predicted protein n=1 Tax=Naegleria gruberi TaxID=5762 RepID=D2V328_NAEGR|nr:uncharacterized protein NAEGRDRAFT_63207 [Naegleria gruberi]EFC48559.1 predicted protein [Naegleria gruberi]|eukprot:XP_002681303.1 predicted protein [Naegleria gruberi strain NEG-M]